MTVGPAAPAGRRRAGALLSLGVLLLVLAVGGWYVWSRREEVAAALVDIGPTAALGCLVLTLLGVLATGECWRVWLASLAVAPPWRTSHQVFYLTQSGKYLPGSLWPFLAQALLSRRFGVPRGAMLTATTLFLVTHVVTGVVVGVLGAGPAVAAGWRWLLYPAAAAGCVLLLPPVLLRVVRLLERRRGRAVPAAGGLDDTRTTGAAVRSPGWSTVGQAVLLMLLAWACYGGATWLLAQRLDPDPAVLPLAVGAYALAWVVGFLAVAAPAGVGAREAVVAVVLSPVLGTPGAVTVALVSRAALTVVDLGLAAASSGVLRTAAPTSPPTASPAGPAADPDG